MTLKGLACHLTMKISLQLITFPFWLSFNSSISQAINYLIKDGFHWNWKKENFSPNSIERYLSYWRKSWTLRMTSTIKKGSWAVRSTVLFESFWNSSELTANFPQFFLNILSVRFFIGLWWSWIHKVQTSKTLDFRWQGDVKAIVCALLRCLQQIGKGIIPIRNKCAATLLQRGFKGGIIRVVRENSVRGRIYENRRRWRPKFFPSVLEHFLVLLGKCTWRDKQPAVSPVVGAFSHSWELMMRSPPILRTIQKLTFPCHMFSKKNDGSCDGRQKSLPRARSKKQLLPRSREKQNKNTRNAYWSMLGLSQRRQWREIIEHSK